MDEFNNQNNQPVQQPVQPIPVEPEKQGNPISIVAMICGIIGIVCGFIPVPGVSIAGLILAILPTELKNAVSAAVIIPYAAANA